MEEGADMKTNLLLMVALTTVLASPPAGADPVPPPVTFSSDAAVLVGSDAPGKGAACVGEVNLVAESVGGDEYSQQVRLRGVATWQCEGDALQSSLLTLNVQQTHEGSTAVRYNSSGCASDWLLPGCATPAFWHTVDNDTAFIVTATGVGTVVTGAAWNVVTPDVCVNTAARTATCTMRASYSILV